MSKFCIAVIIGVLFLFFNIHQEIQQLQLSIDSNNAILVTLRDKAKQQEAEERVDKIKANIRAFNNTPCQNCHVAQTRLLLPIDNRELTLESFINATREGNLYMPSFDDTQVTIQNLEKMYQIIYKAQNIKTNGGGGDK